MNHNDFMRKTLPLPDNLGQQILSNVRQIIVDSVSLNSTGMVFYVLEVYKSVSWTEAVGICGNISSYLPVISDDRDFMVIKRLMLGLTVNKTSSKENTHEAALRHNYIMIFTDDKHQVFKYTNMSNLW